MSPTLDSFVVECIEQMLEHARLAAKPRWTSELIEEVSELAKVTVVEADDLCAKPLKLGLNEDSATLILPLHRAHSVAS